MPYSSDLGKAEIKTWLAIQAKAAYQQRNQERLSILDVGPGSGTYARMADELRFTMDTSIDIDAVEVHSPYVKRFGLDKLYRHVFIADARDFLRSQRMQERTLGMIPDWDVIILGDVLEHMSKEDATWLWNEARCVARSAVIASVPLGDYPQGAEEGNAYEAHLSTWDTGDVYALGGVTQFHEHLDGQTPGKGIGVYLASASVPQDRT